MRVCFLLPVVLMGMLAVPVVARAQPAPDFLEQVEGPTRMDALLGNGRLTAGLSDDGVVTMLRWPSPSYFDQLHHLAARPTAAVPDPRTLPRMGASRTDGLFLGVVVDDGRGPVLRTLDDPAFAHHAGYASDTSRVAVFTAEDATLRLTQQALVRPDHDVLLLGLEVEPKQSLVRLQAFLFAHPAPTVRKEPRWPVADVWLDDPDSADPNGFAALVDADADAVLALAPWSNLRELAARTLLARVGGVSGRDVDGRGLLDALEPLTAAALAFGCDRPAQRQVGADDDGRGLLRPRDALADLTQDTLEGNQVLLGDATLSLRAELPTDGRSSVMFYVALGASPVQALAELADARAIPPAVLVQDVEQDNTVLKEVALPDTDAALPRAVALRALLDLDVLTDGASGAVVASAATQPAVPMDRPTDAALVDAAWAHGGRLARALEHRVWWSRGQRLQETPTGARGSYPGGLYADGEVASLVDAPLDGLGLSLWAMGQVVQRSLTTVELADPTAPLRELSEGARLAVDAVLACWDEPQQQPCAAAEWDWPAAGQSVWTTAALVAGLRSGVVLMGAVGDGARVDLAAARLEQLRPALERQLSAAAPVPLDGLALALGMAGALEDNRSARESLLDQALGRAEAVVEGRGEPVRVFPVVLWQLLVAAEGDDARTRRAQGVLDRFLDRGLTPLGQVGLATLAGTGGQVEQRVGMPAAAAEAALYLALLQRHGRRPPPSLPVPDLENCGCPGLQRPGEPTWSGVILPLAGIVLARRSRRRGT